MSTKTSQATGKSSKQFAVFDIDGTLYRGNLTWDFFKHLTKVGGIAQGFLDQIMPLYDSHDKREVENSYHVFDSTFITTLPRSVANISKLHEYWEAGHFIGTHNATRLYTHTRNLLMKLKQEGYILIAITYSIGAVAKPFAEQLGFDYILCSEEIVESKRITGYLTFEGLTKGQALMQIINDEGLLTKNSYGVGDTLSDASFLCLVENPIAFNPEKYLRDVAIENGWPIIIERKDTIYQLDPKHPTEKINILK